MLLSSIPPPEDPGMRPHFEGPVEKGERPFRLLCGV
jgi:hypothetical protein